jgi:hypothetical protein
VLRPVENLRQPLRLAPEPAEPKPAHLPRHGGKVLPLRNPGLPRPQSEPRLGTLPDGASLGEPARGGPKPLSLPGEALVAEFDSGRERLPKEAPSGAVVFEPNPLPEEPRHRDLEEPRLRDPGDLLLPNPGEPRLGDPEKLLPSLAQAHLEPRLPTEATAGPSSRKAQAESLTQIATTAGLSSIPPQAIAPLVRREPRLPGPGEGDPPGTASTPGTTELGMRASDARAPEPLPEELSLFRFEPSPSEDRMSGLRSMDSFGPANLDSAQEEGLRFGSPGPRRAQTGAAAAAGARAGSGLRGSGSLRATAGTGVRAEGVAAGTRRSAGAASHGAATGRAGPARRGRRIALAALLVVLVLVAGTAAIVAVYLTAPDAPAGSLSIEELSNRAKARLQQWGLSPP